MMLVLGSIPSVGFYRFYVKKMSRQAGSNELSNPIQKVADGANGDFDFDAWVVQVKRQMMEALRRRGLR
jgi:hypothetical protein